MISIPESGLFLRNGKLVTGRGREVFANDLILFTRYADAQMQAKNGEAVWAHGDREERWGFPVIPVLVSER